MCIWPIICIIWPIMSIIWPICIESMPWLPIIGIMGIVPVIGIMGIVPVIGIIGMVPVIGIMRHAVMSMPPIAIESPPIIIWCISTIRCIMAVMSCIILAICAA